ncbi:hypothetical protein QJS10_CPB20g01845 [Acorus calamus]|uniref:Protein kish n=1 Tax=Acorus calamus TaxID=4465 RepID=A0AAV9CB82_ACOCL|nr:hypothetical protein QJS10_CPB20g01845 [Acorus calamus]
MSALFNFHSFLTVVLLVICTCTYVKMHFPAILEQRTGKDVFEVQPNVLNSNVVENTQGVIS